MLTPYKGVGLNNIYFYMNFYNISQIPERRQTAQHFHSSLQEPTLDNVEAQLYAARQRNYQLSMQYFQNKYGNSELYNKFVETNSLEGLGAPKEPVYDFKRELQKKALEIQEEEMVKIKNKQKRQDESPQQGQYESKKYKRHQGRKNIWEKEEMDPVVEHNQEQKPQAYHINVQDETSNVFMSEFKNYLSNKKKVRQEKNESKLQLNQTENSQFKESSFSQSPTKKKQENGEKCYEEELVKKMFREITGKTDKSTRVQKVELIAYLNSNPKILKVLGITPETVSNTITTLECKDHNLVNINEGLMWIYGCLGKGDVVKKLKAEQQFEAVPQGCMLSKQIMQIFEDTFRAIDRHNDLIIKRVPFIARLTSEPLIKKNLNLPAVFQPQYNRHVSLRRIFQRIQIQTLLCSEQQRKVNEYISWNQFINYFQSGHTQRSKYDLIVLVESLKNQQKFGFSHLPESVSDIIASSFKKIDQGEEMFNTIELINQIKLHKDYQIEKYTFIKQGGNEEGNSQTFEDILMRIKENGLKYVNPKEFLEYFSERGKPIEEFQVQRKGRQSKTFSPSKVTFVQNQMFPKAEEAPDGYDSDPEIYNNSKLIQAPLEARKSKKQFKRFKQTAQSFIQPNKSNLEFEYSGGEHQMKITVPKPFSFDQREKQRQMALSQQKKLEAVPEQSKFKAAPVPEKIKQVGLYQKILTDQQKKNEDRKKSSMIMTLANERPFSFENRKVQKKTREQREEFIFKAKPIPWYCSVDLLNRKKEEQIIRKERIAKTAQQSLTRAKLPPRMEKDFLEKEAKKAISPNSKVRQTQSMAKVRDPPDFSKLHKQFEEAMQRKRKQNKTTEIKEFKFSSTKDNFSKLKVQESEFKQMKRPKYDPPQTKSNIDIFAQSTAKFTLQVQKRRKEEEEKKRIADKKRKQQEERMKVDEELKRKVQEAARRNKENNEKEVQEKNKEESAKQMNEYKSRKQELIDKARKQPMLMERVSKRDEKIEKMKKLWEISQTLLKNGIKGKQHDHYFKREQLLLIDDYKQLKDKL